MQIKNVNKNNRRNGACRCGSGKKFKKCCLGKGWTIQEIDNGPKVEGIRVRETRKAKLLTGLRAVKGPVFIEKKQVLAMALGSGVSYEEMEAALLGIKDLRIIDDVSIKPVEVQLPSPE